LEELGHTGQSSAAVQKESYVFLKDTKILYCAIHNVCSGWVTKHHIYIDFMTCDDQMKEDERGQACSKHGKDRGCRKTRTTWEVLDIGGRTVLKWTLKRNKVGSYGSGQNSGL
jgi:hypothetical protein